MLNVNEELIVGDVGLPDVREEFHIAQNRCSIGVGLGQDQRSLDGRLP